MTLALALVGADSYKRDVIETLVEMIQPKAGDDRVVLLLGYQDQIVRMLDNVNPGLKSRFPKSFIFEDYTGACDFTTVTLRHLRQ